MNPALLKISLKIKLRLGINSGVGIANYLNKLNSKTGGSPYAYNDEIVEFKKYLIDIFVDDVKLIEKLSGKKLDKWKV